MTALNVIYEFVINESIMPSLFQNPPMPRNFNQAVATLLFGIQCCHATSLMNESSHIVGNHTNPDVSASRLHTTGIVASVFLAMMGLILLYAFQKQVAGCLRACYSTWCKKKENAAQEETPMNHYHQMP